MPATPDEEFAAFYGRELVRLVSALTVRTGDRHLAADVAQEALARAYSRWDKVRLMESPGAWVYKVATNLATSTLRRRRYERGAVARTTVIGVTDSADRGGDSDVLELLRTLPVRQREAICYRFLLDLSVQQTSHEMSCAAGTVRALTAQGVARLRLTLSTARGE